MPKWLRVRENRSEWCVTDLDRKYRVCAFNDTFHKQTHVHYPILGPVVCEAGIRSRAVAEDVMRTYANKNERFHVELFKEVLKLWKL